MSDLKIWGQQEIARIRGKTDRLFDALCSDLGLPPIGRMTHTGISLREDEEALYVTTSLPGIAAEDIEISADERRVVMGGRTSVRGPLCAASRSVRKEVALPCRVATDQMRAVYKDGLLTLILPKRKPDPGQPGTPTPD